MTTLLLRSLTVVVFAVAALAQGGGTGSPRRVVYLLAGQSNVEGMQGAAVCASATGQALPNVDYWRAQYVDATGDFQLAGPLATPGTAMLELGHALGVHHAAEEVEVVMMAIGGSALLARNQLVSGAWIDDSSPLSNRGTLMHRMAPVLQSLAQRRIDELHIVWGQGETDCLRIGSGAAARDEYWYWSQVLFGWMALLTGNHQSYRVHLITLGSIELPDHWSLGGGTLTHATERVRDAYFRLERQPIVPDGWGPFIASAAHHYDLPHVANDPLHLAPCAYVTLAQRIADGVLAPAAQAKVTARELTEPIADTFVIPASVQLAEYKSDDSPFFGVEVNGAAVTGVHVRTVGSSILVQLSTPVTKLDRVTIRYVKGSGFGAHWALSRPITADASGPLASRPLEPFVLSR
ncbi:MAG: hypothetical protein AB7O97_06590 [Planctomycetota bacterium]